MSHTQQGCNKLSLVTLRSPLPLSSQHLSALGREQETSAQRRPILIHSATFRKGPGISWAPIANLMFCIFLDRSCCSMGPSWLWPGEDGRAWLQGPSTSGAALNSGPLVQVGGLPSELWLSSVSQCPQDSFVRTSGRCTNHELPRQRKKKQTGHRKPE